MKDFIGIFDDALDLIVTYPLTLFYLFFSPEKLVGAAKSSFICPPGASLIVSLAIFYFAVSAQRSIIYPSIDWPRAPSKTFVIRLIVLIIFILLLQYLVISIPSLVPIQPYDTKATVGFLSYPVSAYMVVYGICYLIFILFPIRGPLTIEEKLDPIWRDIRKGKVRIVAEENANTIGNVLALLAYFFCLYNVIRIAFQISFWRAIFLGLILAVISLLLIIGFKLVFERYDRLVKDLVSDKTAISDQRIDVNKTAPQKTKKPEGDSSA